jgi:hypothetical protein
MTAELQFLEAWIPDKMEPGTVFLLEGPNSLGHANDPFVAVLGNLCSAEFGFDGDNIRYRSVQ